MVEFLISWVRDLREVSLRLRRSVDDIESLQLAGFIILLNDLFFNRSIIHTTFR